MVQACIFYHFRRGRPRRRNKRSKSIFCVNTCTWCQFGKCFLDNGRSCCSFLFCLSLSLPLTSTSTYLHLRVFAHPDCVESLLHVLELLGVVNAVQRDATVLPQDLVRLGSSKLQIRTVQAQK